MKTLVQCNALRLIFLCALLLPLGLLSQSQCSSLESITVNNIDRLSVIETLVFDEGIFIGNPFWSADGKFLVVNASDGIRIYDAANLTQPPIVLNLEGGVRSLENGQILVSVRSLPSEESIPVSIRDNIVFISGLFNAISPDGKLGVNALPDVIQIIDLEINEVITEYPTHFDPDCDFACYIVEVAISPDAQWLIYSTMTWAIPQAIINLETGEANYEPQISSYNLTFSPDGQMLVSVAGDWAARGFGLTDISTGEQKAFVFSDSDGLTNAAFSPDGRLIAFGSVDPNSPAGYLTIWDVEELLQNVEGSEETALFSARAGSRSLAHIAFHPSGTMIATTTVLPEETVDTRVVQTPIKIWGVLSNEVCTED